MIKKHIPKQTFAASAFICALCGKLGEANDLCAPVPYTEGKK